MSERALYALLVFLTIASAANVLCAVALWALPVQSIWRIFAAITVLVIAGAIAAGYFVTSSKRDSLALGEYASNRDELVKRASTCGVRVPQRKLSFRDPGKTPPWQDLLVVFFAGVSTIIAVRAACIVSTSTDDEEVEQHETPRRKTVASLRCIDADTQHSIRERSCAVCLETMSEGALSVLPCAHAFHENCIGAWIAVARKRHCPVCMTCVVGALRQTGQPLNVEHADNDTPTQQEQV